MGEQDLITRLEAAERGSRELSWRMAEATGHEAFDKPSSVWPPFSAGSKVERSIPDYTESLDAIFALVERTFPEGRCLVERDHDGRAWARVRANPNGRRRIVDAATPALALCAALLRALSQGDAHG